MADKTEMLRDEYRIRFTKNQSYRNQVWKILCDHYFGRFISPNGHVLDLGSGWGEFINNVRAAEKYAMDLNPDTARHLAGKTRFLHQDCSQPWQMATESVDVVFTSNFLEHLPDKASVTATVAEAHRCLKQNGLIILMGPNIKYAPGAYWDFWDHYIPLTELSVSELLKMQGFSIRQCTPRFVPYSMSAGLMPPLVLVKWYLKLPFLWPVFGKQFLVIGVKRRN
jgi:SAM-dependent methyltransferase